MPATGIFNKKESIKIRGQIFDLSQPLVMGILNVTPDSFYDGGRYLDEDSLLARVAQMIKEGVDIVDIGACSTRPGAEEIDFETEMQRLLPALKIIRSFYPEVILSVDTFRSQIAQTAIQDFGIDIVNDISAGNSDPDILKVIASYNVPYVVMHMQGTPQNMQLNPVYTSVVTEVVQFLASRIIKLKEAGICDIIVDPGFGFGKSINHNYELLAGLEALKMLELPVLVGLSRKSMIWKVIGKSAPEALNGSTALNMVALQKGANILRVHDVAAAVETIKLFKQLYPSIPVGN